MHFLLRATRYVLFLSVMVILCVNVAYPTTIADYKPEVKSVHWSSSEGYTRVVVDLTKNAKFNHNRIKNPERVYVDIERSILPPNVDKTINVGDGVVKRVRISHFDINTVRVVLDLNRAEKYEVYSLSDPVRVIIDVFGNRAKAAGSTATSEVKAG